MQKAIRHMLAVLGRVLFIGLSLQVILGIVWACANWGTFQQFGESLFYIEVSESFLFDEYTGALYPVFLMLARGLEDILRIPYTYAIQLLQILAAGYAGWRFFRLIGVEKHLFALGGSLALVTFPMLLQCHLAILPNSLTFSVYLLELAFAIQAVQCNTPPEVEQIFKIGVCWVLSALLMPDYLYFGAVPALLVLLCEACKYRKKVGKRFLYHMLLVTICAGTIIGVGALVQERGCYGRPERSVEASLFRRVTWTSLTKYYEDWPQEMQQVCSHEFVVETAGYADNMERLLQPALEDAVGAKRAQELYLQVGEIVFHKNKSKILHEIAWDAVGYTLPPITMQLFLNGRGYDSYVGRNYEIMKAETPMLTKYYVHYSSQWFPLGIGVATIMELLGFLLRILRREKGRWMPVLISVVSAGLMIVWYTMQGAGCWDYKNSLLAGALWVIWMTGLVVRSSVEERREESYEACSKE